MRVLLIGNGEFFHVGAFFRRALSALGHECAFVDESIYLRPLGRYRLHSLAYRLLGKRPLTYWKFNRDLIERANGFRPDIVLITGGCHVSPHTLAKIRACTGALLINYATDDPFNRANSRADLLAGIRCYDLYACTKRAIMEDVKLAGCPNVCYVPFAYEPSLHFPERPRSDEEGTRFAADVTFIGGADLDRRPYFESLAEAMPGLQLSLYGGYWDRSPRLREFHRGFALGRDYRLALCGAKIAPCLVRRANRDGHAMRTFEIPACGVFVLAERSQEHMELFEEGLEADFFGSPEELSDKVAYYLKHETQRLRMAEAAHRKITTGKHTYQDRLQEIFDAASSIGRQKPDDCRVS
jgi:spore maturation protein CgeB